MELTDQTPFKEWYLHTPLNMYEDVKAHIQEMLHIGAIKSLHSLWVSMVVLVQKKGGSLSFVSTFRKLSNQTIKDAYLLPLIDETLSSLWESQWLSSLDLKSGYCQVKMDEESKPLTTFTIGPFGFL